MCFGLVGASATMQRLMGSLFTADFDNKVFCYLDDIIIGSADFEEHIHLLKAVYKNLRMANLTINVEKSRFCRGALKYLGYVEKRKEKQEHEIEKEESYSHFEVHKNIHKDDPSTLCASF